jgi:uncharacterized protein YjfI (DUF2170 family)
LPYALINKLRKFNNFIIKRNKRTFKIPAIGIRSVQNRIQPINAPVWSAKSREDAILPVLLFLVSKIFEARGN